MTRCFLFMLTALFILGYAVLNERTLAYWQNDNLLSKVPTSTLSPSPTTPNEKTVMGVVRHIDPPKGIIILETRTDMLVVRAPTDVCQKLHKGDVVMATLIPDEEKIPI